jgi:hypothetical protein
MTDWVISHSDVVKHPNFNTLSLEEILYSFGMDVYEGYEIDGRDKLKAEKGDEETQFGFSHRSPFTGEIHTCPRYTGKARTDGKWKIFTEVFVAI